MGIGDRVKVRAYGGEVLERRVVGVNKRVVYVSSEEEYQAALQEGREPNGVGFLKEAVQGGA